MKKTGSSGYPEEISLLKIVVTYETRSRLRVKIIDAENKRYEVDLLNTSDNEVHVRETDYEFSINMDLPGFTVYRKSNGEVS